MPAPLRSLIVHGVPTHERGASNDSAGRLSIILNAPAAVPAYNVFGSPGAKPSERMFRSCNPSLKGSRSRLYRLPSSLFRYRVAGSLGASTRELILPHPVFGLMLSVQVAPPSLLFNTRRGLKLHVGYGKVAAYKVFGLIGSTANRTTIPEVANGTVGRPGMPVVTTPVILQFAPPSTVLKRPLRAPA